jgi:pSer/pThr/pTyr-binding forkhead associated (FHA) protein
MKDGMEVDEVALDSLAVYVVGSLEASDITFNHPSISRKHAVVAHDADGTVHVVDLGSTHGWHARFF